MAETSSSAENVEPDNVLPIGTKQELEERKNDNRNKELLVYGFTSKDYQQPSRIMSRTFRKLSVDKRFKDAAAFFEMDVDNFQDLARQYKLDVYPAFLLLNPKDTDKEVGSRVTGINPGKLETSIEEALNKLRAPVRPTPAASQDRRQWRRRLPYGYRENEELYGAYGGYGGYGGYGRYGGYGGYGGYGRYGGLYDGYGGYGGYRWF